MTHMSRTRSTLALLGGCASGLALAAACAAPSAHGQAFQGTPTTTVPGAATITRTATTDTIEVNGTQTVIDWVPFDTTGTGTIDFLPNGLTALFRNNPNLSLTDFTVLNRIQPVDSSGLPVSRVVAFNGTVQSQLYGSAGGSVWFYAPGGILAGPTSVFNVGSLILTTDAIDITGGLYDNSNKNTIRFRGAAGSSAAVVVQPGAKIDALAAGSYVALVAPRVVQSGTVNVDGSVAYVGAEGADIRINGGLFDIDITTGTSDANGVVHDGTTTGPASTGSSDVQRVFMVAVPKNNALTMLLSGDVGYAPAAAATPDGSAVVLSAGYDIAFGDRSPVRNGTASADAGFSIGAGSWQSDLSGGATGDIVVRSSGAPSTHFLGNVTLSAERRITLRADQSGVITADKDVSLTATSGATGGRIDLLTFGGSGSAAGNGLIDIAGALTLNADGNGDVGVSAPPLIGANGIGGTINIAATGGQIDAASLTANVAGFGGFGSDRTGDATGGAISLSALSFAGPAGAESGALRFGTVFLDASAGTGSQSSLPPINSGNATGGTISIGAAGGSFIADGLDANANAFAGDASGVAGNAIGGSITLFADTSNGVRGNFTLNDCARFLCTAHANGFGGLGVNGSNGTGGSVLLYAANGDFSALGDLALHADGNGGLSAIDGQAGRGGDGLGGSVTVESRAGGALTFGNLFLTAQGSSGQSIDGPSLNDGTGGNGTGGTISVAVTGGSLVADKADAQASGFGGGSADNCPACEGGGTTPFQAGIGQGGSANFLITGGTAAITTLALGAVGTGGEADGARDPSSVAALAGAGRGGAALLESRGGIVQADTLSIDAGGAGGAASPVFQADSADGGIGSGGNAGLLMTAGGTGQLIVSNPITISALGKGGNGADAAADGPGNYRAGAGGGGTGGTVDLTLAGGALTAPSILVSAEGIGGTGGDNSTDGAGGAAGNGTGGTARFAYLNEGHSIGDVIVKADGQGGQAGSNRFIIGFDASNNPIYDFGTGPGGAGGAGGGGNASLRIDVDPSFANLTISADGIGSAGGSGGTGSAGGAGTGGIAALNLAFGTTMVSGALRVTASGLGGLGGTGYDGPGGRGGDALGGTATLGLAGTSTLLDAGNIGVLAQATGGAGGLSGLRSGAGLTGADGGNATGGTALFAITAGATAITGDTLLVSGDATGGAGELGTAGPVGGTGGAGGNAIAGSAGLRITDGHMAYSSSLPKPPGYAISAVGQGGAGAAGSAGSNAGLSGGLGGRGGDGAGGQAAFDASNGDYVLGGLNILADGLGGAGGLGGSGPAGASAGGLLGVSSGGTVSFVNSDSGMLAPGAQRLLESLDMSASGASGGSIIFTDSSTAANGGLRINGSMTLAALGVPVAGFSGISVSGAANPVTIGGNADLNSDGPLAMSFTGAGGWAVTGALTGYSGTRIDISHSGRPAGSNSLSADTIQLSTPGDINILPIASLRAANMLTLLSQGGNINLGSGSLLDAGGDLRLFAQGSLNGAGATARAAGSVAIGLGGAAGNILLGNLSSGGLLDQADASGNALGTGGLAIGGNFLVSGRVDIGPGSGTISAARIAIGTLAADSQQLTATTGDVQIGNALMSGNLIVNSSLVLGNADITGLLQVAGASAQLTGQVAAGAIDIAANSITSNGLVARTGGIVLQSLAGLSVTDARAAGAIVMGSSAGGLTIGNAAAGGALTLTGLGIGAQTLASGGATLLNAGAGSLVVNDIASAGAITALGGTISLGASGGMTIAQANASSGPLVLNAGGLVNLLGMIDGPAITIGSSDIVIGPAAQVGTLGRTASLTFNSVNRQASAYIGGGDVAGAYSLSAAELGRVAAGAIAINAPGIIVRDWTIGTANLPGGGVLTMTTPGTLRIEGAVRMTGVSGQGGLTLSAGNGIEVIAGPGLIDLGNGNGALAGVLTLSSPSIIAATPAAISDVALASTLNARELRLAQNDGVVSDAGILRAGIIRANAANGFYIQNTGLSTGFFQRRGFTANDLIITAQGGAPQIAINGRLALSTGGFATGLEVIPLVTINGALGGRAGGYAAGSKINGCLIASVGACVSSGFESRDTWNGVLDPSVSVSRIFTLSLIELRDIVAQGYPPLIDEPVTGAGNEDLWERSCGGPDEPACGDGGTS